MEFQEVEGFAYLGANVKTDDDSGSCQELQKSAYMRQ